MTETSPRANGVAPTIVPPAAGPSPRSVTVGVLALQGDFREHREKLEKMGQGVAEIRKPAELEGVDALIIPGGESTTIARLILSNGFQQPLRDFCDGGRPVWGTCAGAILLARQVDDLDRPGIEKMNIRVRRNAFGRQVDSFEADILVKGIDGPPFRTVFIRAPLIEEVSPPAGVLARLDDGTIVAARQGNLLATSFHPELTSDLRLHEYFLSIGTGSSGTAPPRVLPVGLPSRLAPFIDAEGRFGSWPVKEPMQREAIAWLAGRFERDRGYTESEVNAILDSAHTFTDPALLRRLMCDWGVLRRERDGSRYWLVEPAGGAE